MKRRILGEAVLANAIMSQENYKRSDAWLQNNVKFNHFLRLQENKKMVIEQFLNELMKDQNNYRKREQKLLDLEILVNNLLYQKWKPISISLNINDWKKSRYNEVSAYIITLVHILHEKGFIDMKLGYKIKESSRQTRIWATEKLLKYCPHLPDSVIYSPTELVELRDSNGKLKLYEDTAKTRHIRGVLKQSNNITQAADIRYMRRKINAFLFAIFIERFTQYGRLHTRGYQHYQGFSGDDRKEFTINGDPVIELDFSALHPNLLYAEKGIQYDGDPYSVINDNPIARPFLKAILLRLLNNDSEVSSERASNYWLFQNPIEMKQLKEIGITRARPLIEGFKNAHQPISEYFCKGKKTGLKIMNKDAMIALDIINHFSKLEIPILAVHDSFIIQRQYKKELRQVMQEMYAKHTGGFRCGIK